MQKVKDIFEQENRKFLHALASPLAILKFAINRLNAIQHQERTPESESLSNDLMVKAMQSIQSMEELHANFKAEIHARNAD